MMMGRNHLAKKIYHEKQKDRKSRMDIIRNTETQRWTALLDTTAIYVSSLELLPVKFCQKGQ